MPRIRNDGRTVYLLPDDDSVPVKNLLGKILNAENLKYYESLIGDRLKKEFEGELDILSVELLPHKALRAVTVNVIAIDRLTGNITSTTATAR